MIRGLLSAAIQQGSLLNQIPAKSLAALWLDGTILHSGSDYYFVDKIAGNNVLITGYDFPTGWVKGFPYKSAATIDIFGQTGVPVISLFQNFDYENKYFTRHVAQVVDANGVETSEAYVCDIVAYSEALTGDDLTDANVYYSVPIEDVNGLWMTANGNDTTGDGTKAKPWKTVNKIVAVDTGAKLYFKSNTLVYPTNLAYGYLLDSKNNSLYFVGNCKYIPIDNTYSLRLNNANIAKLRGLNFQRATSNGSNYSLELCTALSFEFNYVQFYAAGSVGVVASTYLNNIFKGPTVNGRGAVWASAAANDVLVSGNFFELSNGDSDVWLYAGNNKISILNNKSISSLRTDGGVNFSILKTTTGDVVIKGNYVRNKNGSNGRMVIGAIGNLATSGYNIDVSYNTIIVDYADYKAIEVKDHQVRTPHVHHNNITYNVGNRVVAISFHAANALIENNIINCPVIIGNGADQGEDDITGEVIANEIAATGLTQTVRNNKISSNRQGDGHIHLGYTTPTNSDNKVACTVEKNHIRGFGYYNEALAGSAYGIDIGNQKDAIIRHNWIEGIVKGIQITGAYSYVSGGIWVNIIKDCFYAILVQNMDAVSIVNNTIVTKHSGAFGIYFDTGAASNVVKNNIVILSGTGTVYGARDITQGANVFDYNIYHASNGTLKFKVNATEYTFAEWQALGYDTHSIVLTAGQFATLFTDCANCDYSLAAGSTAIGAGLALDADYDDGLDSTTDWGDYDTCPEIVTKQQGAAWDCGAYVH